MASADELGSVVLADGGRGVFAERVEQADGVGLAGELADGRFVGPLEGRYLAVGLELPAGYLAAEDQGDNAAGHVLVHACERVGLDVETGLLTDLAAQAVLDGLAEFQGAPGRFPVLVVAPPDEQHAAVVIGDDAADADGMSRRLVVHKITSRVSYRHIDV